jgi:uncharacterized RDD family membrane protein YckC
MHTKNQFSDKFASKSSHELRDIIASKDFQREAKQAAIWELESREEVTEEEQSAFNKTEIEAELRRKSLRSGNRYTTFWPRFLAAILDGMVLSLAGFVLGLVFNATIGTSLLLASLFNNLAPYIYSILFHGYEGQTPGKMAAGVKVVSMYGEGDIDWKQACLRDSVPLVLTLLLFAYGLLINPQAILQDQPDLATLAPMIILGMLSLFWTLIEIISMLFNDKSRAVHDLIANTVVIRTS